MIRRTVSGRMEYAVRPDWRRFATACGTRGAMDAPDQATASASISTMKRGSARPEIKSRVEAGA